MSYYVSCDCCEKSVIKTEGYIVGDNIFCSECYRKMYGYFGSGNKNG